jgi:hypothetical protein
MYWREGMALMALTTWLVACEIESSRSRAALRTDVIDLYQCHRYDMNTLEETQGAGCERCS